MNEQRLEHMEDMLSQLISMVGGMRTEQAAMKEQLNGIVKEQTEIKTQLSSVVKDQAAMREELTSIKTEQSSMREEMTSMKTENDRRHRETMDEFKIFRADQDHIWSKTVQNERDIAQLKHRFSN
ncbi:hypothetical protein [Lentibacillus amyloliquefaciens]|uniref:Uncharacterized protein n=1 Tax=Lentibacillus amyloliquefaciens TaxID=1472767 RepID=A0A0U4FBU4_9BACI|nr:hypothetical protein [Lentibacillus amyloliquefaciens]ALX50307.1 hypothetical protein AOX59_18010 [Lentibacillus amyloliquefaciens]